MLGKLIAYEWKATWKLMVILNAVVIVLSGLGVMFASVEGLGDMIGRTSMGSAWMFIMFFSFLMVYILGIFALSIGTTIYFYVRFYRNIYTDQGYLMHTLPVTEHELILSKAIVAFIWRMIGVVITSVGVGSILVVLFGKIDDLSGWPTRVYREYVEEVYDGNSAYFFTYIILMLLCGLVSVVHSIFMGYAAISIGQLASKNKVLASIGAYFGIMIIVGMISNTLSQTFFFSASVFDDMKYTPGRMGAISIGSTLAMCILSTALAVGGYFITHYMMKKKLNLE
ncbi:MAG: hypothetical protein K5857_03990 [Lachnospiraceae bacterium]|nr:hypothetical protein [Lachnospiraceae bacterium]